VSNTILERNDVRLNFDNNIPIYIQLVEYLKKDIILGKFKSGERLPSVRDLALSLKVNPNTMQKALMELEEQKLIYTERTNGKYVTEDKKIIDKIKKEYAKEVTNKYLCNRKSIGFNKDEVINYINELGGE